MKVGLLTLYLHLPATGSLKEKRSVIKRILAEVDRCGPAFAVAEVENLDDLGRATIRIAHLANDPRYTDSALTQLRTTLELGKDYAVEGYDLEIL
ncbi:DUF503 domain-containing protein [Candidatus Bipolaricaulota bacterium]|uniref:DUF503 domain-containing protein n=1 Tax=marine sediment metagenome TaxID=412755 RepID=X1DF71_9ZZZZ|nr:DUF503 domain-containing protein [Candidatus Bipolaricaulota bacterium]MCK4599175.1 DUF503 domain-containing protein [Candidatus Bipolaricaulota bacterium]